MKSNRRAVFGKFVLLLAVAASARQVCAATWTFGSNMNGLSGASTKTLPAVDSFALQLSVHNPVGGRFYEADSAGVSVDSGGLAGISDVDGPGKINLLSVGGVAAAAVESVQFSFDKPGVLTGIDFDGIKDESLEHFVLTSSGGLRINFFDSFANTTIPGAVEDAIAAGAVIGPVVYLLELSSDIDDEAQGLHIPFAAGQQFVLTYAELGAQFHPEEAGNGARFQGITVQTLPEPTADVLALAGGAALACRRRSKRASSSKSI